MINVSDKAKTLPSDTLIATAYFPCQYLYLHAVSDKMLKEAKTFNQDCLHANLHQAVAIFRTKPDRMTKLSALVPTPQTLTRLSALVPTF